MKETEAGVVSNLTDSKFFSVKVSMCKGIFWTWKSSFNFFCKKITNQSGKGCTKTQRMDEKNQNCFEIYDSFIFNWTKLRQKNESLIRYCCKTETLYVMLNLIEKWNFKALFLSEASCDSVDFCKTPSRSASAKITKGCGWLVCYINHLLI